MMKNAPGVSNLFPTVTVAYVAEHKMSVSATFPRAEPMTNFLIVDTETSGLSAPPGDNMVEIGCVKWSLEDRAILECWSALIDAPKAPHKITGIPASACKHGVSLDDVVLKFEEMQVGCDALMAHNAPFDKKFLGEYTKLPWICTKADVNWPKVAGSNRLIDLALAHGVGVGTVHRALDDCLLIARMLERTAELGKLEDALGGAIRKSKMTPEQLADRKQVMVRAVVPYERRQEAKDDGFSWKAANKMWTRTLFEDELDTLHVKYAIIG